MKFEASTLSALLHLSCGAFASLLRLPGPVNFIYKPVRLDYRGMPLPCCRDFGFNIDRV